MRRKNLGLKVAALAVTGTIAVSPMTVRAEEGTAGTAVSAPAPSGTTATTPAVTGAASTSAASTTTPAASTTATTTATTTTTATATPAAPVTVTEPAADPATTVPNEVNNVVNKDDFQGTKINADGVSFEITPDDVKDKTELSVKSSEFNGTEYANKESGDLVMKGDLSIEEKQGTGNFDSTETAAHDVESGKTYSFLKGGFGCFSGYECYSCVGKGRR